MPPPVDRVPPAIRGLGKVHHVALIVALDRGRARRSGATRSASSSRRSWTSPRTGVRIAFLGVGESKVELVEPTDDTTGVARFLASKGEGFHHVCFEVANLAETLLRLEIDGAGADRQRAAPRRRGPGRVHPPAVVPRRARRADRGAGRAGLDEPRVLAPARPASSRGSRRTAGIRQRRDRRAGAAFPSSSSTRQSTVHVAERVLAQRSRSRGRRSIERRGDRRRAVVRPVLAARRRPSDGTACGLRVAEAERSVRAPSTGRGRSSPGAIRVLERLRHR